MKSASLRVWRDSLIPPAVRLELLVDRQRAEVTTFNPEPDPLWRHVDPLGHVHMWRPLGLDRGHDLPSLVWVVDERWTDEYGDECSSGHYACRWCHSKVIPGYQSDYTRRYVYGAVEISGSLELNLSIREMPAPGDKIDLASYHREILSGPAVVTDLALGPPPCELKFIGVGPFKLEQPPAKPSPLGVPTLLTLWREVATRSYAP